MRFNPPPGWPLPQPGWQPHEGWTPDPSWPPAPNGWQFWVRDSPEQGSLSRDRAGVQQLSTGDQHAGRNELSPWWSRRWLWAAGAGVLVVAVGLSAMGLVTGDRTPAAPASKDDVLTVAGPGGPIALDPDGTVLAAAFGDKIRFWDPVNSQEILQPLEQPDGVSAMAFSPDGRTLAALCSCGGNFGKVQVWDVSTGRQITETAAGDYLVEFSPDGETVATGSTNGEVLLWDSTTGDKAGPSFSRGGGGNILAAAFSPDGATLATSGTDRAVRLWDTRTGRQVAKIATGHTGNVNDLTFSPDGKILASGSFDGTVKLWNTSSGRQMGEPFSNPDAVFEVVFSPGGRIIATAGHYNGAMLWDLDSGQQIGQFPADLSDWVSSVAFTPDGASLITGRTEWVGEGDNARAESAIAMSPISAEGAS